MLRIGPFNYDPLRGVDLWLAQSDEFLLTHLSTSPEVEPPHFAMEVSYMSKRVTWFFMCLHFCTSVHTQYVVFV